MQLDFFTSPPTGEIEEERFDISTCAYPHVNTQFPRQWKYSDIPEKRFYLYKTGGTNPLMLEKGKVFPKLVNVKTGNVLKPSFGGGNSGTYPSWMIKGNVSSTRKDINLKCHRLIAECFLLNTDPFYYKLVDHEDQNPYNFELINLRWSTRSGNASNVGKHNNEEIARKQIKLRRGYKEGGLVQADLISLVEDPPYILKS
mgnify:FL=1|tara:strand:+ start:28 stop:627 length:600 start_codon:yes stop_codon:yes gene_type:complete